MIAAIPPELLVALQRQIPLEQRPFERLGAAFGLAESAVLAYVEQGFADGTARRFGAVFESSRLGYASTLCAVTVPAGHLEIVTARLIPLIEVTHCYERAVEPNLWFTLTARADQLAATVASVAQELAPHRLHVLPALQMFKIEAVFERRPVGDDTHAGRAVPSSRQQVPKVTPGNAAQPLPEATAAAAAAWPRQTVAGERGFDDHDRAVIRLLQASLPVVSEPFAWVAAQVGLAHDDLLERCRRWRAEGVIRRVGLILRHRELGLRANSLCVWTVPAAQMEAAGRALAASSFVSHAYERPPFDGFPFNLYAMVHAETPAGARQACRAIEIAARLPPAHMLWSLREFKKTSPAYFIG